MSRLGRYVLLALALLAAIWIGLLMLLPEAPLRPGGQAKGEGGPATAPPVQAGGGGVLALPIAGMTRQDVHESWGDPRENGLREHHGTDLVAPANTAVIAAAPGTVEKLWSSAAGGTTVYVRSPAKTLTYYYAHLSGYAPGLHEGQGVNVGDLLGYVGDTGNAGAGNFHLHFGLTRTTPDQHWYQGVDVDPYPYLAGKRLPG